MNLGSGAAFAPAKVNLFLHVGPLRADGFHPIASLMAFADVGDRLEAAPATRFSLEIDGPFAAHAPDSDDNLVVRAARALFAQAGLSADAPIRLRLTKSLPAAAGLGGGSSDAAAALMLLRGCLEAEVSDAALRAIAAGLGSDIPACLAAVTVLATGRGEILSGAPDMPVLPAVLVRPDAGSATGPVYRAFDALGSEAQADVPGLPPAFSSPAAAARFLAGCRNDLEAPAAALEPAIGRALEALRARPETLLGRMSGSGSACFALCADTAAAERLATAIAADHPEWWVKACRLGAPIP